MIIKITTISSSHGHNAINYAMNKKDKTEKRTASRQLPRPFILASNGIPNDNIFLEPPNASEVWMNMKMKQMQSRHRIKDGFFRIEICPSKEECQGWRPSDWQKLLDDAIRHLDSTDFVTKSGKVIGKHTDIAHSQYVAAIHRDTDNYHIHLIVNRITMDDRLQDANKVRERGFLAANKLAEERGWVKAIDRDADRKERIHGDALAVLRQMKAFDLEEYFKAMRAKGWLIETKYDSQGICRGYSIGEKLYKPNGSLSSTVMYQSSKLGFGRDLMASRLQGTWNSLHPTMDSSRKENKTQNISVLNSSNGNMAVGYNRDSVAARQSQCEPKWKCSDHVAKQDWNEEGTAVRIPNTAFSVIDSMVQPLGRLDYYDRDEDIPTRAQIVAVAVFEFLTAANVTSPSGGGGGSDNDLRWDGKTEDELQRMAAAAAHKAIGRCTSHLTRRKRGLGR